MSNRIDKAIARAQAEGRVAFIGLVPIDPDSMERTRAVADMMIASGVDIVMVHIPNWMPWMEGGRPPAGGPGPQKRGGHPGADLCLHQAAAGRLSGGSAHRYDPL